MTRNTSLSLLGSFALLGLLLSQLAISQTYRWVASEGVTHFSQTAPEPGQASNSHSSSDSQGQSPNQNSIAEKEEYLGKRETLLTQIRGTINEQRRDQLKRQLNILDLQWYEKHDPEKAAELKQKMDKPKIRVIPQNKQNEKSKMDRMKAFY